MYRLLRLTSTLMLLTFTLFTLPAWASSVIITFDDLDTSVSNPRGIPIGYDGFRWISIGVFRAADPNSSYGVAAVSPPQVAYGQQTNSQMVSTSGAFDFVSGYFTSAHRDDLILDVIGISGGTQIFEKAIVLQITEPTFVLFNWDGVDTIRFSTSGGTGDPGYQFAMDSLTVDIVPEPSAFLLLGSGLSALGIWRLRKRS